MDGVAEREGRNGQREPKRQFTAAEASRDKEYEEEKKARPESDPGSRPERGSDRESTILTSPSIVRVGRKATGRLRRKNEVEARPLAFDALRPDACAVKLQDSL